jgi:Zn-dependent protease with chaperone function
LNEDKATRYNRLKRRASVLSLALTAAFLGGVLATGVSVRLRDAAGSLAAYVLVLTSLHELLTLPVAAYGGLFLERRYGLSVIPVSSWLRDHAKAFAVGVVLSLLGAGVVVWSARLAGRLWWIAAASVFSLAGIALAALAPVVLLPLFYKFKPLDRPALSARLLALTREQGIEAVGVFEWGLGAKTSKANAALVGLGSTRRIILADTLLDAYTDDEIEVILAHELGHHVHRDMWKAIALESGLAFAGAFAADLLFRTFAPALGILDVADPAGLPLLVVGAGAVSVLLVPLANAASRRAERRADRFALALTKRPEAFVSAMRRLSAQNLAEEHPSRLVQTLFYSHPPIPERVAAARAVAK